MSFDEGYMKPGAGAGVGGGYPPMPIYNGPQSYPNPPQYNAAVRTNEVVNGDGNNVVVVEDHSSDDEGEVDMKRTAKVGKKVTVTFTRGTASRRASDPVEKEKCINWKRMGHRVLHGVAIGSYFTFEMLLAITTYNHAVSDEDEVNWHVPAALSGAMGFVTGAVSESTFWTSPGKLRFLKRMGTIALFKGGMQPLCTFATGMVGETDAKTFATKELASTILNQSLTTVVTIGGKLVRCMCIGDAKCGKDHDGGGV